VAGGVPDAQQHDAPPPAAADVVPVWVQAPSGTGSSLHRYEPGDTMNTRTIAILALVIAVVVVLFLVLGR
jgi:hypothetical protein